MGRQMVFRKYESEISHALIAQIVNRAKSQIKYTEIAQSINEEILEHVAPVLKENAMLAATAANQALTELLSDTERLKALTPSDISALSKVSKEQTEVSNLKEGKPTAITEVQHIKKNKDILVKIAQSCQGDPVLTDAES